MKQTYQAYKNYTIGDKMSKENQTDYENLNENTGNTGESTPKNTPNNTINFDVTTSTQQSEKTTPTKPVETTLKNTRETTYDFGIAETNNTNGQDEELGKEQKENLKWNRVHYLTPILTSWKILVALVGIGLYRSEDTVDLILFFQKTASTHMLYMLAGITAILLVMFLFSYISWTRMGYSIDQTNVYYKHGIIFKNERYIKLTKIQTVDIVYPLLGRIFGLGQIKIESAGGVESNITISYMKDKQLNDLRNTILALMAGIRTNQRNTNTQLEENPQEYFNTNKYETLEEKLGKHELEFFAQKAPEKTVYELDHKKFIQIKITESLLGFTIVLPILLLMFYGGMLALGDGKEMFTLKNILKTLLPTGLLLLGYLNVTLWSPINKLFGYTLKISPDGFRTKTGLTSLKHETIPPNRIHALRIAQPLVWRVFKKWEITTIKAANSTEYDSSGERLEDFVVMTEADKLQKYIKLVYKQLSNTNDNEEKETEIFLEGLTGKNTAKTTGKYFHKRPSIVRLFSPLEYSRLSYHVTENVILIRHGFFTKRLTIIPHERAQSLALRQGPIQRRFSLANIEIHLVQTNAVTTIRNIPLSEAKTQLENIQTLFRIKRLAEPNEKWMKRVYSDNQ